jgi:DNA invertase Pin-like site-specific DNA recombinase
VTSSANGHAKPAAVARFNFPGSSSAPRPVARFRRYAGDPAARSAQLVGLAQAWNVSVLAVSGFQFDLSTPHGKMIASLMAALAAFERDLIRDRVTCGLANAKARGKKLGRQVGQRPTDRKAANVAELSGEGLRLRLIGRQVGFNKNTVGAVLRRQRRTPDQTG